MTGDANRHPTSTHQGSTRLTRNDCLTALDHIDDAANHLQAAFIASGNVTLLGHIDALLDLHGEHNQILANTVDQPALPLT